MKGKIAQRLVLLFFFRTCLCFQLQAQPIPLRTEPSVESSAAAQSTPAPDEDPFEEWALFLKKPLLLNEAGKEELQQLVLLPDALIDQLLLHRKLFGPLLHVNELQAIAGFTPEIIRLIKPFVSVMQAEVFHIANVFSAGSISQDYLCRVTGFFRSGSPSNDEKWVGNSQRILFWHRLQLKNIQAGWLVEKDPGEALFRKQMPLIDHAGFHFFWRGNSIIRTVAIGDFTINLGQGLIHWQSMAFGKSSEMSWLKRQGPVLRAHRSSGEVNFHRGVASTMAWKQLSLTVFASRRSLSGSMQKDSAGLLLGIGSISNSGYHRTAAELQGRKVLKLSTAGMRLSARVNSLVVSLNAIGYRFSLPLLRDPAPRNNFDIQGRGWFTSSLDFSYTQKNFHSYGEWAIDANGSSAFVVGAIITPAATVDLFLLARNISKSYRAVQANAFTESSGPENEKGFYSGITLRPHPHIRVDAYGDQFIFPWLRYRVNAPSAGSDYLLQLHYHPHKKAELLIRYRTESKWEAGWSSLDSGQVSVSGLTSRAGWRGQVSYQVSRICRVRTRVERVGIRHNQGGQPPTSFAAAEHGFLYYLELLFNKLPLRSELSFRCQYFDTKSYQSRIYAL
ncbi:MAG: helix-hairpin-helix domain-containing protein, partial [Chitinophagia bacterium]|nr:helix-hairpin-helix domain-containing protein [Chitinophagia bacterium]